MTGPKKVFFTLLTTLAALIGVVLGQNSFILDNESYEPASSQATTTWDEVRLPEFPTLVTNLPDVWTDSGGTYETPAAPVHRTGQSFDVGQANGGVQADDITNDPLIVFDKSKTLPESSAHDRTRQQLFEPRTTPTTAHYPGPVEDNFGADFQKLNASWFPQVNPRNDLEDVVHPYPPAPGNGVQRDEENTVDDGSRAFAVEDEIRSTSLAAAASSQPTAEPPSFSIAQTFVAERTTEPLPTTTRAYQIQQASRENTSGGSRRSDYDPALEEEIDYNAYDGEDHTDSPFHVTKSLMDAMDGSKQQQSTASSSFLHDSEATVHPTLHQPTLPPRDPEDYEMVTSDYVSLLDQDQRDIMFPRDHMKPWELKRGESPRVTTEGRKRVKTFMNLFKTKMTRVGESRDANSSDNRQLTEFPVPEQHSWDPETTTPYYTRVTVPTVPSIYGGQPLSSFVVVPSGYNHINEGESAEVSDTARGRPPNHGHTEGEMLIERENTVQIHHSDYSLQPQFKLYQYRTAAHRASGVTTKQARVDTFRHWLANPAAVFNIPMPLVLGTAFAVSKAYGDKARAFSSNSRPKPKFALDSTRNQLKYTKIDKNDADAASLPEGLNGINSSDFEEEMASFGQSTDKEEEIESYVDLDEIESAEKDVCSLADLSTIPQHMENGSDHLSQCFVVAQNCLLSNAAPIERRINLNLVQCAEFCAGHANCRSFSYSAAMSICDVFTFKNGTSESKLLRYHGYSYFQPFRKNVVKCLRDNKLFKFANVSTGASTNLTQSEESLITVASRVVPGSKSSPCPGNSDVLALKADHYRLRNFGIRSFDQTCSESECTFSCLIDIGNGSVPFNCTSASFNVRSGRCHLYPAGSNIRGNGHLVEADDYTHYEKVCADLDLVDQCRGLPVDRFPQKVLLGFVTVIKTASSLLECITYCYQRYKENSDCLSVGFHYTRPKKNCFLNSESHLTASPYFTDELEVITDYASIDRCLDVRDDLINQPTVEAAGTPTQPLAIDNEDGSRILNQNPGFGSDIHENGVQSPVQSDGEQTFVNNDDYDNEESVSHSIQEHTATNEIRRSPLRRVDSDSVPLPVDRDPVPHSYSDDVRLPPATFPESAGHLRQRLKSKLRASIHKVKH